MTFLHKLLSYTLFSLCPQGGEHWQEHWQECRVFIQHFYTLKFLLCVWRHFCSVLSCGLQSPSPPLRELDFWWGEKMDSVTRAGWEAQGGRFGEEWGGWGIKSDMPRGIAVMRASRSRGPACERQEGTILAQGSQDRAPGRPSLSAQGDSRRFQLHRK